MAYLVKDTFRYTGDQQFNTLEDFLQHFWQGTIDAAMDTFALMIDTDQLDSIKFIKNNIIDQHWDSVAKTYTRTIDFTSPVNYISCRSVIGSMPWSDDDRLIKYQNNVQELVKITEILG